MEYSQVDLENKIMEMYPLIEEHGIDLSMEFNDTRDIWIIKLDLDGHELTTNMNQKDAEECMKGNLCIHLGVQVGEFIGNFEGA